jgi:ribose transport system permease protein
MYAIGFDAETARLTGLPVARLRTISLLVSGVIAAFAGIILAASVGSADPNVGASYLIPAFSATFLGATQFRGGRFNTWGTLVAVFLLATGDYGMIEVGGPTWATSIFEGVVLLIAIGFVSQGGLLRSWRRRARVTAAAEETARNDQLPVGITESPADRVQQDDPVS